MTTTTPRNYCLQNLLDGRYDPTPRTYDEARAIADTDGFMQVCRIDELPR